MSLETCSKRGFYINSPVDSEDSGIDLLLLKKTAADVDNDDEAFVHDCAQDGDEWSPFGDGNNYPWIRVVDRHGNYLLAWLRVDDCLRGYRPDEIKVELDATRRRVRVAAHSTTAQPSSRAFQRDYKLPQNLSFQSRSSLEIQSCFTDHDASLIVVVSVVSSSSNDCHHQLRPSPSTGRRHSTATCHCHVPVSRAAACRPSSCLPDRRSISDLDFQVGYGLAVLLDDATPVACHVV